MKRKFRSYKSQYIRAQRRQQRKLVKAQLKSKRRFHRIRKHPFVLPALLLLILLGIFAAFLVSPNSKSYIDTSSRIVIISHDGKKVTIPTKEPTVGTLLQKLAITLNNGDVVEPAMTTKITQDDFRVNIYRARPVELVDGNRRLFSFSAETTPIAIVQQSGVTVYPEDNLNIVPTQNFLTNSAIGEQIVIDRAVPVNVNLYGTATVIRTRAKTVAALLKDKHINLEPGDTISPDLSSSIVPQSGVYLVHKGTQIITTQQTIPMPIQATQDNSLAYGTSAIRQQGSPGVQITTYQLNLQNGKEIGRTLLQTVVTRAPIPQIVVQGTNLSGIKGDMALAGIAPQDYQYVDYIVGRESGWCPTKAQGEHSCPVTPNNAYTSNGYGLCQATPGYKMQSAGGDWATNPVTQLVWCNGYASRYGGWYGSYQHWLSYRSW